MSGEIQFISAEELAKLAEIEREQELARSTEGMVNAMQEVYQDLGGTKFMRKWAKREPGEFFRLQARLLTAKGKNETPTQRIYIGLPTTELDE